ncbi:MAG: hypothetical protein H2174_01670 [Vampirovibrio sp.]|nr:hypothetical protein [Vampirovibrio sp.]
MIVSASTPPLTTKLHKAAVERHQPAHAKPRGVSTNGSVEIHHDTHEKEAPKTPAQRIAALGSGVLLTTAITLLSRTEDKAYQLNEFAKRTVAKRDNETVLFDADKKRIEGQAKPKPNALRIYPDTLLKTKPAALLTTDAISWVKSLGLLAGVQGINAGLGLHLPPVINALELGAVSHVLIPGTLGSKVAHFMTMAPLLIGSVGVTQLAHGAIDPTVDKDDSLTKNEKQLTKSLLGMAVSIGMGVGAMALFPRIHMGLSGLDVKFQSNKVTGAKAGENWYITTTKTVDGWQHATGKAWEQLQTKLQNKWERTWKKTAERPPLNKEPWFDKNAFKTHAEVPWSNPYFYEEKPEDKLFALQKAYSQTLEVLPEPYTWQEKALHWLNGKQSPVAKAILTTRWHVAKREAQFNQAFLTNGAFQQFEPFYKRDINHVMGDGQYYQTAKQKLIKALEELSTPQQPEPISGNSLLGGGTGMIGQRKPRISEAINNLVVELAKEAPTLLEALKQGKSSKQTSPFLQEYLLLKPHFEILKAHFENSSDSQMSASEIKLYTYLNALTPFFDANNNVSNGLLPKITLLGEQLYDWHSANPTITFSTDASLNKQLIQLITAFKTRNETMGSADLSADLSTVQQYYLPITEQLETAFQAFRKTKPDCVECENENTRSAELKQFYARVTETLTPQLTTGNNDKAVAKAKKQATEIADQLALLHDKTEHLRGHVPGSAPFWAMTGAAAGAVTCGSGCCAGSFFCLNEATALFGSLFGALVTKLGWNQSKEESEKKKQKAKV